MESRVREAVGTQADHSSRFVGRLAGFDSLPSQVLDDPNMIACLLPIFRADFAVCETYRHANGGTYRYRSRSWPVAPIRRSM